MSFKQHFTQKNSCKTNISIWSEKRSRNYRQVFLTGILAVIALNAVIGAFNISSEVKETIPILRVLKINIPDKIKPYMFRKSLDSWKQVPLKKIRLKKPSIIASSDKLPPIEYSYNFFSQISKNDHIIPVYPIPLYVPENQRIPAITKRSFISIKDELITFENLDYGKYKGLAFQSLEKKQSIKGFIHLATAWGIQLTPPFSTRRSVTNLAEALKCYTDIDAKVDKYLLLDSRRLFSMPFVFITAEDLFELTGTERRNFREYLKNGGFAVLDNFIPVQPFSPSKAALKQMLKDVLGAHARFLPIPVSHPIYHCYFDFDDGPPISREYDTIPVQTRRAGAAPPVRKMSKPVYYLEGIWLGDRLVAVYSDKGYAIKWKDMTNNAPQLKMGVNMVVFALTQEGGIAKKNMKFFSE